MIDRKTIEHIAKLARLEISEDEAQEYSVQIGKALEHFETISAVNTVGIEPMVTPTEIETYWREDEPTGDYSSDQMIENAPAKAGNLFKVPPVV